MIFRQPNGKLCMCSYNGKVQINNMTEGDYVEYCTNEARKFINNPDNILNFGKLIETSIEFRTHISDEQLKEMGSDKTFLELMKFVPRKPINKQYVPVNFETQGKCPNCGGFVVNGMGGMDQQCKKCGQILKWDS